MKNPALFTFRFIFEFSMIRVSQSMHPILHKSKYTIFPHKFSICDTLSYILCHINISDVAKFQCYGISPLRLLP